MARTEWPAEVVADKLIRNAWRVEKLDSDGDGGIDVAVFMGPDARKRAVEYAVWKYQYCETARDKSGRPALPVHDAFTETEDKSATGCCDETGRNECPEITLEMIEAGVAAFEMAQNAFGDRDLVVAVYTAMRSLEGSDR